VNPSLGPQIGEQTVHFILDLAVACGRCILRGRRHRQQALVYVASGTPRSAASAVRRSLTCGETLVDKLTVCDMSQLYAHATTPASRGNMFAGAGSHPAVTCTNAIRAVPIQGGQPVCRGVRTHTAAAGAGLPARRSRDLTGGAISVGCAWAKLGEPMIPPCAGGKSMVKRGQ
jgi:hypothetical protein